ncbi:Fe-S cluster assembly protein SufD [Mangrovibacter sp. SLW1]
MAGLAKGNNPLQQWHHLFVASANSRNGEAQAHMQQLLREGLPDRKQENWKYTSLDTLSRYEFVSPRLALPGRDVRDGLGLPMDAVCVVLVNGRYAPALSDDPGASGFRLQWQNHPGGVPDAIQPEVFLHLTESMAPGVLHIEVPPERITDKPLVVMHISMSDEGNSRDTLPVSHTRCHVTLGRNSKATIIEYFASQHSDPHFTGARLSVVAGENSELHHFKLGFENPQACHFSHNDFWVNQDCRVFSNNYLLGGQLVRHHTSARINGENTTVRLNSLALPVGREVCDSRTWLAHNKGYGNSRQLHKMIVQDNGRAVFNGQITVAPHAIKTDGQMTNNNLLIGRLAEVDTKPQLEIYADDVKCSHGATVGRIDDEQLFYLQARGISRSAARRMIIYAFAAELTDTIGDESLRNIVLERIGLRLPEGGQL